MTSLIFDDQSRTNWELQYLNLLGTLISVTPVHENTKFEGASVKSLKGEEHLLVLWRLTCPLHWSWRMPTSVNSNYKATFITKTFLSPWFEPIMWVLILKLSKSFCGLIFLTSQKLAFNSHVEDMCVVLVRYHENVDWGLYWKYCLS